MNNQVATHISELTEEGFRIKGYLLEELIGNITFGDLVYLLMTDELPTDHEGQMIEAMLVSCVDHGMNAPSVNATRTVASCGVPVPTAIAAGVSAIGDQHGGAGAACAKLLQDSLLKLNIMSINTALYRNRINLSRKPDANSRIGTPNL